jgi:hypothetical protein
MAREKLTNDQKEAILEFLCTRPLMKEAAEAVGVTLMQIEDAKDDDAMFEKDLRRASKVGSEATLEVEAFMRAMGEYEEYELYQGVPVSWMDPETGKTVYQKKRHVSDKLLSERLKAERPDKYGDRAEVTMKGSGVLIVPAAVHAEEFNKMLAGMRPGGKGDDDGGKDSVDRPAG